jgi:primase-polymerase (primpol)-like protein
MTASLYANLPAELRLLKQWTLWKYEDVGATKPTKVPYQPNGKLANVAEPSTWSTFDEVFNTLQLGNYSGIGFIFSHNDPYTFIDLDDAEGDDAVLQRHLKVYHEFETYAEVSPSGKGLHLICKGTVPAGRRRSKIEIYPHDRYATMTGNVYQGRTSIIDCQPQLTQLWEQMGSGPVAQSMYNGTDKELITDDEITKRATDAINGDKFNILLKGNWQELYSSQSEADFAFIDIVSFYTQNRNQITRIFRNSPLGFRDKAKRADYVSGMISRSFDRMLPPLDFDGLKNAIETKLAETKLNGSVAQLVEPTAHNSIGAGSSPAIPTTPPGLLGEIAVVYLSSCATSCPEVALAAAIGLMSGICGRAYNISGTGLKSVCIAPSHDWSG